MCLIYIRLIVKNYFTEPLIETVPIPVRYLMRFSTALIPQLQLCHFHWLLSVQSVNDLRLKIPKMLPFLFHGNASAVVEKVGQDKSTSMNLHRYKLDYCSNRRLTASCSTRSVCILSQMSRAAHCVLRTPDSALLHRDEQRRARSVLPHLTMRFYLDN